VYLAVRCFNAMQAYFDAVYVYIVFNALSIVMLTPAIVIFCIFRCGRHAISRSLLAFDHLRRSFSV